MDGNFRVGQWLVQPQLNLIQGPGGTTSVEPKAMEVLVCLSQQSGEVVSKERLMQTVWADTFVTDEVLTNSIWELRKAFGDDAKNPTREAALLLPWWIGAGVTLAVFAGVA
ncbi:MAG TPA: winged helix-turn-helix domain-containing protein, partial [Terriglobia bacterium]|nr:winged helix-turn-helix domain-containing protein [Terriglobia bacterium]